MEVLVTTLDYSEYSGLFDLRTDLEDYDKPIDRFHLMLAASSACPPSWGSLGYVMATPRTMPLRMQADDGIEVMLLLEYIEKVLRRDGRARNHERVVDANSYFLSFFDSWRSETEQESKLEQKVPSGYG